DDIASYLQNNQLIVTRWDHNPEFNGRIAEVALPKIQLQLIDPLLGLFSARLPLSVEASRLAAWAKSINFAVNRYDPLTGGAVLQLDTFAKLGLTHAPVPLTPRTIRFTPPAPLPAVVFRPPSSLTIASGTAGAKLDWHAGSGAVGYAIYRSVTGAAGYTYVGQTSLLTYTDRTAPVGVSYSRVMALHSCNAPTIDRGGCPRSQQPFHSRYATDPG